MPISEAAPSPEEMSDPPEFDNVLQDMLPEGLPSEAEYTDERSESTDESPRSEEAEAPRGPEQATTDDPTFRIGSLPAANKKLVAVNQCDSLTKAITLMLQHDFSQLPVMQGEREVKGMVTWKSIGSKHALGCECTLVGHCREDARIVDSNRTLFDAIPTIVEFGYVLVRDQRDRRITGIVTASDLSLQFQALAEPFLLLREIELHVRELLRAKLSTSDFDLVDPGSPLAGRPQNIENLTFGQYVRLFQHPAIWRKLDLKIDGTVLTALLEEVRVIRNDVMHFDPDPMTPDELYTLKKAVRFMQQLYDLLPKSARMEAAS